VGVWPSAERPVADGNWALASKGQPMDMSFKIDSAQAAPLAPLWTGFDDRVSPWLVAEILADLAETAGQRGTSAQAAR
jgi:hypothetical protein